MATPRPFHLRIITAGEDMEEGLRAAPEPDISVRCHRRLRGPYTGAGTLLREHVIPELLNRAADLLLPRRIEIAALAPELAPQVPAPPSTLTEQAGRPERTRYYNAARTRQLAHGVAELLIDWARACRPDGVIVEFRDLGEADPTDLELIAILLRRCDAASLTFLIEGEADEDDRHVISSLAAYTQPVKDRPNTPQSRPSGMDLAQVFIDSDGTDTDPAILRAYVGLPLDEQARRHTARADELTARNEPTLLLGAVPYHAEHGIDAAGVGVETIHNAMVRCLHLGYYHAAMDLAIRGRALTRVGQPKYAAFTHGIAACLAYLDRGPEAIEYLMELRRVSMSPQTHMDAAYMLAMLYTRHLPRPDHDEDVALEWVNTAIAIADQHPDPNLRIFRGAFMRNARALVELHRGNPQGALDLVQEAAQRMDASYGPTEHLLHRSVLKYNRGQVLAGIGENQLALTAFDEVIDCDPEYAEYYFERAGLRRKAGWYEGAFKDYECATSLSLPFFEVYVNRADMLRELEDDEAALGDLNYALDLEPDHIDSLINRADILLGRGETERAGADIEHGLRLEPGNLHLLTAQATLLAEAGDTDAAYASYTAALKQDPKFAAAWANRAVLLYSAGRIAEAIDDLDQAIALAPEDPTLPANRAMAVRDLAAIQGVA